MAFDNLSGKLQDVFKKLRGKGKLSEDDIKTAMTEVKRALLEADVNFKVVKKFINSVSEKAVGEEVMKGLNPGQMVIKIVRDELVSLMGSEITPLVPLTGNNITIVMMCGLQGAGKTTTAAKLASQFKNKGKKPLLVACDIYRPAAIEQLMTNGKKVEVPVFSMGTDVKPVDIVKASIEHAKKNSLDMVFIDTAGRLQIDDNMMQELKDIKEAVTVNYSLLTVDSMTGQNAVDVAKTFNEEIGIDGIILTKLDGDTRGGAALSIRAVTGKPIMYVGMGEKLTDFQPFYPDRMASRILGMGDVESLIEKAEAAVDANQVAEMEQKIKKASFDFNDYLTQMDQLNKMGDINDLISMVPGLGSKVGNVEVDPSMLEHPKAIIYSMTKEERSNPDLINVSRKQRIAKGCGLDMSEVNRFLKQFNESKKMMKQLSGMMGKKKHGKFKMPFGF